MAHLKTIINIKLIILFSTILCISCNLQTKETPILIPKKLVTLIFSGAGEPQYSHIITINSDYELIYEIGIYNDYIDNNADSLIYDVYNSSIFITEKRNLTPLEIKQFCYYYAHQDSLYYKSSSFYKDGTMLNLFIKNKRVAYYYCILDVKNTILYDFSHFLLGLVEEPYAVGWIDYEYLDLFPKKRLKKGDITNINNIIYIDEKGNIKIEKYND